MAGTAAPAVADTAVPAASSRPGQAEAEDESGRERLRQMRLENLERRAAAPAGAIPDTAAPAVDAVPAPAAAPAAIQDDAQLEARDEMMRRRNEHLDNLQARSATTVVPAADAASAAAPAANQARDDMLNALRATTAIISGTAASSAASAAASAAAQGPQVPPISNPAHINYIPCSRCWDTTGGYPNTLAARCRHPLCVTCASPIVTESRDELCMDARTCRYHEDDRYFAYFVHSQSHQFPIISMGSCAHIHLPPRIVPAAGGGAAASAAHGAGAGAGAGAAASAAQGAAAGDGAAAGAGVQVDITALKRVYIVRDRRYPPNPENFQFWTDEINLTDPLYEGAYVFSEYRSINPVPEIVIPNGGSIYLWHGVITTENAPDRVGFVAITLDNHMNITHVDLNPDASPQIPDYYKPTANIEKNRQRLIRLKDPRRLLRNFKPFV